MARLAEALEQLEAIHARQIGIDHKAGFTARPIGFEEGLAGRIGFDGSAFAFERAAKAITYVAVVIDDEDDGRACRLIFCRKGRRW
jgi:hypothetical protein